MLDLITVICSTIWAVCGDAVKVAVAILAAACFVWAAAGIAIEVCWARTKDE